MNSIQIRQKFLDFFKKHNHTIVPSSSLIPLQDPTLLFTNAGMNQFKDVFLGNEKRNYTKATSIQKCVRAGGKHNDLEEVGFTNKHLTFFEMMGNFSFGDYFKKEAIKYAWDFLTKEIKLPIENLVITIYKDDDDAHQIWNKDIGIPSKKIIRLGEKDNFWQMGDTGPCGPCSEIHFDYGKNFGCQKPNCGPDCSCNRFVEIWNLVFMQYNRQENGKLLPLEQTGIDTGMGFERLCMILQKKDSIFQIDLFETIIKKIENLTKISYKKSNDQIKAAFHVLCDHIRSSSFLISDGCLPSNEGRGYVLRKIIRRAALFAQKLSDNPKLFSCLSNEFIDYFFQFYQELKTNRDLIIETLNTEIEKFTENLKQGQTIIQKYIKENLAKNIKTLSGHQVFKLYDTYGFPTELTKLIAAENNFDLDLAGFEKEMKRQQKQSGKKDKSKDISINIPTKIETEFVGYTNLEIETKINFVKKENNHYWLVTEKSPFYVESGGQVSDKGWIVINKKTYPVIKLYKTNKPKKPAIAIFIKTEDQINIGNKVKCLVDSYSRKNTEKNHTATHMLQAALIQVCDQQIKQAGSFVNETTLRFDFTYNKSLTKEKIEKVEEIINNKIQENIELNSFYSTLEKAKESGVTAIFGEKYNPEKVRIVQIPGFSAELCGGTHTKTTGEIGCFKIETEESLSSGIRRITAITGPQAIKSFQEDFNIIKTLNEKFKVRTKDILSSIEKQEANLNKALSKIKQLKKEFYKAQIPNWQKSVTQTGKIPFLFLELKDFDNNELKQICLEIENKSPGFYFIINKSSENPERLNFFGYLSKKWEPELNLKEFSKFLREKLNFKGGGSSNLIQGGGNKTDKNLKREVENWLKKI